MLVGVGGVVAVAVVAVDDDDDDDDDDVDDDSDINDNKPTLDSGEICKKLMDKQIEVWKDSSD